VRNRDEIWNELTGISPTVAKISPENLYKVPDGYFEDFPAKIFDLIGQEQPSSVKSEIESLSTLLGQVDKQISPSIPSGYFENFAENLLDKIKAGEQEPAENPAILNGLQTQATFNIPEGYFENFAEKLMARINAEETVLHSEELENLSPILSKLGKSNPFSLPEGYFNKLSENVVSGAKAVDFVNNELENLSPLMNSLKEKKTYEVPAGYFDSFPNSVLSNLQKPAQAKVISIHRKTNWMRYAAAAMVVGIILTSTFFIFNNNNRTIAKVDEKQLTDSLHNVNDEDILNYMQSHNIAMPDGGGNTVASIDTNDEAANDLLADISDSELQQYASEHYGIKESLTN
jgi:hypothetical protein